MEADALAAAEAAASVDEPLPDSAAASDAIS